MSSDLWNVNRELLEEFIRAYENQPCPWRIKSSDYHDRAKKDAAYKVLLSKYRLIDKSADKDVVVKKINAFRTNYRREKKKIDASLHSGIGTDEIYQPSQWYYHLFDFLGDQEIPRGSSSNLNNGEEDAGEQPTHSTQDLQKSGQENEPLTATAQNIDTPPEEMSVPSTPKRPPCARPSKRSNDKCDSVLETIEEHFKKPKPKEDRYTVLEKNVAPKMRDISNNTQRLLAEKLINETLFLAVMGQFTMSHAIRDNNDIFSEPGRSYYQLRSPVTEDSDISNQSLASNITTYGSG